MDDLGPAQPCMVVEEMTSSSGSENSAIGAEPSKNTPTMQLSIGYRSIGPEQQSPITTPSNLPDSLAGELTLQKAGESAPMEQAESSPTIETSNASSQQVLSLVSNSTSTPFPAPAGGPHPSTFPRTYSRVPSLFANFERRTYTSVSVHIG